MARKEETIPHQHFVEKILYKEIKTLRVVGKGSFGVVYKGLWKGTCVALKLIETESERNAFKIEVQQLSRVSHENIVKLYGACVDAHQNPLGLVMEYAEGGSLYNVLHGQPQRRYTAGHAISWSLQCAQGVAYLHNMQPKGLIHRDLKSPNLLLVMGGTVLKICDFGTACEQNTYMTNNKGSAAWMAPEVFEGSKYTEKCDIYSWSIILWEVLSRRKPYSELSSAAYRILWEVHKGKRPPCIEGCPKPIEKIMMRCWDRNPNERPNMQYVVEYMSKLIEFFGNHDTPIEELTECDIIEETEEFEDEDEDVCITGTHTGTEITPNLNGFNSEVIPRREPFMPRSLPADSVFSPLKVDVGPVAEGPKLEFATPYPHNGSTRSEEPPAGSGAEQEQELELEQELGNVYLMLDKQLHPVAPDVTCQRSVQIFEEHKQLAQEYLRVQTEMAYLSRHKELLVEKLSEAEGLSQINQQDTEQQQEVLRQLLDEKKNLMQLHHNLKCQLEIIRRKQITGNNEDGWVVVPHQSPSDPA